MEERRVSLRYTVTSKKREGGKEKGNFKKYMLKKKEKEKKYMLHAKMSPSVSYNYLKLELPKWTTMD